MRIASFSSSDAAGSNIAVQNILNSECATAMPYIVADSLKITGSRSAFTMQNSVRHTRVPITLKERCMTAARFAFLFAPTQDIRAVTQVPIF